MKTAVGLVLLVTLGGAFGCARSDWIDRTLVTVDVTRTWEGTEGSSSAPCIDSIWSNVAQGFKAPTPRDDWGAVNFSNLFGTDRQRSR